MKKACPGKFGTCPNLIDRRQKHCPECAPKEKEKKRIKDREYDLTQRNQDVIKWLNSTRYRKQRARFLLRHPLCAECEKNNRVTEANRLDHTIPHNGNYQLFWDQTNWQSMCNPCHEKKHSKDRWGRK